MGSRKGHRRCNRHSAMSSAANPLLGRHQRPMLESVVMVDRSSIQQGPSPAHIVSDEHRAALMEPYLGRQGLEDLDTFSNQLLLLLWLQCIMLDPSEGDQRKSCVKFGTDSPASMATHLPSFGVGNLSHARDFVDGIRNAVDREWHLVLFDCVSSVSTACERPDNTPLNAS